MRRGGWALRRPRRHQPVNLGQLGGPIAQLAEPPALGLHLKRGASMAAKNRIAAQGLEPRISEALRREPASEKPGGEVTPGAKARGRVDARQLDDGPFQRAELSRRGRG